MKIISVVLLASCLQLSRAAVYMEIVDERPGYPGMCYDDQGGTYHAEGSRWYKERECEERMCEASDEPGKMIIQHLGCGLVAADPPCSVTPEDYSKPYPGCCSSVTCPDDVEEEHQAVLK